MKYYLSAIGLILLVVYSGVGFARGAACRAPQRTPDAQMLLFGELHGSVESPALVGAVVCEYAKGGPVALGLEIPTTESVEIHNYLSSDGNAASKARLLSGQFWRGGDGRSSRAMFDLVEYVRQLKREGLAISIFTLVQADLGGTTKDNQSIAHAIRTFHDQHPSSRIVVLMGNLHAGQEEIAPFGKVIIPAGFLIRDLSPTSVLITHPPGTIWACMRTCGRHKVDGDPHPSQKPGSYDDSPMQGYSMSYLLPSITASPPAAFASQK